MDRAQIQKLLRDKFPDRVIGAKTDNRIRYMATRYLIEWARKLGLIP
jgi:hypothetical protein